MLCIIPLGLFTRSYRSGTPGYRRVMPSSPISKPMSIAILAFGVFMVLLGITLFGLGAGLVTNINDNAFTEYGSGSCWWTGFLPFALGIGAIAVGLVQKRRGAMYFSIFMLIFLICHPIGMAIFGDFSTGTLGVRYDYEKNCVLRSDVRTTTRSYDWDTGLRTRRTTTSTETPDFFCLCRKRRSYWSILGDNYYRNHYVMNNDGATFRTCEQQGKQTKMYIGFLALNCLFMLAGLTALILSCIPSYCAGEEVPIAPNVITTTTGGGSSTTVVAGGYGYGYDQGPTVVSSTVQPPPPVVYNQAPVQYNQPRPTPGQPPQACLNPPPAYYSQGNGKVV